MMTALPSDWNFPKEDHTAAAAAAAVAAANNNGLAASPPVRLEQGFYAGSSSNKGAHAADGQPRGAAGAGQAPLYHDRWSAVPTGNAWMQRTASGGSGGERHGGGAAPEASEHSRGSIWADDHSSHGSAGGGGGGATGNPYGSYISKGNIQADTGVLEDDFEIPGHSGIDLGLAHLSMGGGGGGPRRFPQRGSIGHAASYEEDNTASSWIETATIAGYPSQDFGISLDFPSAASVDSTGTPGLMPASSGSTFGTLFSGASSSTDMAPPPPPGFGETSQKPKYHHHHHYQQHHQQHHHHHHVPHHQRGGRHSHNRRSRGGNNGRHAPPHMSLLPLQEQRNTTSSVLRETLPLNVSSSSLGGGGGAAPSAAGIAGNKALPPRNFHDSGTSLTLDESSSSHSLDISTSSEAIRQLMQPKSSHERGGDYNDVSCHSITERSEDFIFQSRLPTTLEDPALIGQPILPQHVPVDDDVSVTFHGEDDDEDFTFNEEDGFPLENDDMWGDRKSPLGISPPASKKQEWLFRMTRKMQECPVGELDPSVIPMNAVMNGWAKSKSTQGAAMVEEWLQRAEKEFAAGNTQVVPTTKMYTMAVDAWARSGKGGAAAQRAEALLQQMYNMYKKGGNPSLKPTTGIFNAVINAWARSMESVCIVDN